MPRPLSSLDSLLDELRRNGWEPCLPRSSYGNIQATRLRNKNLPLACVAAEIIAEEQPVTLRGLFYRVVSAGWLPSTDNMHYTRLGRVMNTLREDGVVPFSWIVDNVRSTIKPSSWAGLGDFVETVQDAYRKDFWEALPAYVHVFCEKDAVSGIIAPATREFDVPLSPIRGYCSLSFAHEIASLWNRIAKPIHAYYLGDFDPSGFDLERDLKEKLTRYCQRPFAWKRLGVLTADFSVYDLIPLPPKKSDCRYRAFVREHGSRCAELDALPATELRRRVRAAIQAHIPAKQWKRLQRIEKQERKSFQNLLEALRPAS